MSDLLLYICVGVLCALAIASIVALAWLLDDRKAYRPAATRARSRREERLVSRSARRPVAHSG